MKQPSFASLAYDGKKKRTRKEIFLTKMDQIIPWKKLTHLIEPHYPKGANGRPTIGVEKMLRIYFMQQWFGLSDPAMEDALYDVQSMWQSIVRFPFLLKNHVSRRENVHPASSNLSNH